MHLSRAASVLAAAALWGCGPARPLPLPAPAMPPPIHVPVAALVPAPPQAAGFDASLTAILDSLAEAAIAERAASAVAIAVGRHGRLVHLRGYGTVDWAPGAAAVTEHTLFDLASVTKVVATTTAAMVLEEEGRLDLDRTVASYLPEFSDPAKAGITVRMLLTHRGGLEAFAPLFREHRGRAAYLEQIALRPLRHPPGTVTVYSDWDMVLLQLVIERIAGAPLDAFVRERITAPLGMTATGFTPDATRRERIAATEVDAARGGLIWGEVHDPNAWALGGVAGHAGLFGTAGDLAAFAQAMLDGGGGIVSPPTVARWTAPQVAGSSRALGWDTPSGRSSAGRHFGPRSFGHTGYTGTSLWIDPERGLFVVLLTNRVNPTAENQRHVALRRAVGDAVQRAVVDAPVVDWESARGVREPDGR